MSNYRPVLSVVFKNISINVVAQVVVVEIQQGCPLHIQCMVHEKGQESVSGTLAFECRGGS